MNADPKNVCTPGLTLKEDYTDIFMFMDTHNYYIFFLTRSSSMNPLLSVNTLDTICSDATDEDFDHIKHHQSVSFI